MRRGAAGKPLQSTAKALLLFTARSGRQQTLIADALPKLAETLRAQLPPQDGDTDAATLMQSYSTDDDAFRNKQQVCAATLELRGFEKIPSLLELLHVALHRVCYSLADAIYADLSAALIGTEHAFILPDEKAPTRYQYLMRRRSDLNNASYRKHYFEQHSKIGLKTGGISGYSQFHVDPDASRLLAASAGFGVHEVDSVSELHMQALGDLIDATGDGQLAKEAAADEERFVDREHSVMFTSSVALRLP